MSERRRLSATWICMLLLALSPSALAREQYVSGAIELNGDQNAQVAALSGRYGILVTAFSAQGLELYGEVRAAYGITESETKISGVDVKVKIENSIGAYARLKTRIGNSNFSPYMTLGYTRVAFKGTASGEASVNDSDLSFGGGLDWKLNDRWALNIDGMRYIQNSYGDMVGASIGVSRLFK